MRNILFLLVILSSTLSSCYRKMNVSEASRTQQSTAGLSDDYLASTAATEYDMEDKAKSAENAYNSERKVLFSAYLSMVVEEPDSTNLRLQDIAKKHKGYINEIGTYRTTIRVKSELLEQAVEEISQLGKVQNKNIHGQDVTEAYFDDQIRLGNAEKARDRYLELLAKAENVEAALKVERELERLNGTIDMLKGRMNRVNHLAEFSTITINLNKKKEPGILGYVGIGLYRAVKWLFVRN